jgi:hypothetical protein
MNHKIETPSSSRLLKTPHRGGVFPLLFWHFQYSGMISGFLRDPMIA